MRRTCSTPTWTATASRTAYSFYTEGLSLIVEVNDARYTLWLNNFTNNYYLSVTDLDVTDGYREIVVANEGTDLDHPVYTSWQILRYDSSFLYPVTVDDGMYLDDRLTQYGYLPGEEMNPLKVAGDGCFYMPVKGRHLALQPPDGCIRIRGTRHLLPP